ncbi:RagB/SusD family nutrient uptake outer membrane protein [Winogradskyella sp. MH6]|uniref:RagB/SusD family nutrient uptake outer membrane protein n=1 Tax=Winogradskyella sp. MH6 TaxID=2929510 RepID=UPI001FB233F4|nr:RagB/SusD family nutrient uptake outer membrane protein [Winogradskyella sp. MH6]
MRYIFNLKLIVLILPVLLFNCNNKLDEEQELVVLQDEIDYSSEEQAFGALVGAYEKFQNVGWEQIPLISVRGDDVNAGGLGDQQGFADTDNFIYDNSYWMYNVFFENWSQDILQITSQIESLERFRAGGVDSDLIDQYQAECKVLRGYITLQLSRVFGDVYRIQTTDQTQIEVLPKDELMMWISDEMDEAIPNLLDVAPNLRSDLPGGITKYTALAVKAIANLEVENYQNVADAAGEIINSSKFQLYDDYYELFKIPGKLANENIWEIQYSDFGQSSGENVAHLFAFYGPQNWSAAVPEATSGWGFYEPSFKFIKFMIDRGETVRLETSVLFTDRGIAELQTDPDYATLPAWISNTTRDGDVINDYSRAYFASGKHYLPSNQLTEGRTSYGTNKNYTVIRYAEVLLMYAEALTRGASGTAGTADSAVNTVRLRAGLGTLSGVTSEQVMDEKFAELAMEWGIRYYDMIRLGETGELSYDGRTFNMDKAFLPYPQAQLDQSYILNDYYQSQQ